MTNGLKAISIANLTVEYPKGILRKSGRGVIDLSFSVDQGELFGFLGPNGAGKTTTIKVLTGLLPLDSGSVSVLGNDISLKETKRKIGYMPENPFFYEYLTAAETFEFYGSLFRIPKEEIRKKGAELLEKVGLPNVDDVRVGEYSKGMRQRLGFAQALINDPDVLILDEPLSGLDPIGRTDLMTSIHDFNQNGKTVFFSSHILPDVENTCTKVGLIHEGRLVETGPMDEILKTKKQSVIIIARAAEETIKGCTGEGTEIEIIGSNVVSITVPSTDDSRELVKKLVTHDVEVISVTPEKRDLEAFFIDKIREKGGDRHGA